MAWTAEQQKAIDTRDRTLLVSAAAGSGKTATLTERIIRSILDEDNPADIGRMLIATYTNAAVDELRDRIGKAIKKAVIENPENYRLEEQLLRLKDAKILTITSFCNSILRTAAETIGLPPNYRIAEPPEAKILSSSVLEALINAAYEGEIPEVCSPEEFIELADCLSNIKHSEGLSDAISFIFDKLTYSERGIDTLSDFVEEYNPERFTCVENTRYGKYIISTLEEALAAYRDAYKKIITLAGADRVDEKNLPKAESDLYFIENCLKYKKYKDIREYLLAFSPERLSRGPKDPITDFYLGFKTLRSQFTEDIKKFLSDFFVYTEEEWHILYIKLYKLLNVLYKFLKKYYDTFLDEKRRRGICEFSDVERYAYEALYNKDGSLTPLAHELSGKFDAIYVDEYQDVNGLQNKVFSAIAKENNRFMVGDIKQSIYCFRSARPEIFAQMKDEFPLLGDDSDYPKASIFMSNNFRCDKTVVDFVNGIFDTMFGLLGKSIGYVENDRLQFSKIYKDTESPTCIAPEIHIIEKAAKDKENNDEISEDVAEEDAGKNEIQAEHIAKKIKSLIEQGKLADGSNIEPRHIAILMRSVRSNLATAIANALNKHGIASSIAETGDLFMCDEVLLALSFLYSIDNPRKDIYLSAVMMSPIFSFSADEVLLIRKHTKCETLWESLIAYTNDNPDYIKGKNFISSILKYRKLAEGQATDSLLSLIYRETGLLALAAKNGGRENLILLHSYARKYEGTDFKGLYSFISYINAIIERGEEFPSASLENESNAVKIMTVHKSKGLEFPVTFIAGASAAGNKDRDTKIAFTDNFGISIKTKDTTGLAIVDNPICRAIAHYIKNSEFEEELRVLYVALTRAREQLYIYGTSPKTNTDDYLSYIDCTREILSPYFAKKAKSFLDIIMLARANGKLFIDSSIETTKESEIAISNQNSYENPDQASVDKEVLGEEFLSRFNFKYPLTHLEYLPEKLSVSKLASDMLDDYDTGIDLGNLSSIESIISPVQNVSNKRQMTFNPNFDSYFTSYTDVKADEESTKPEKEKPPILPKFITGISERESAKRGIATHKMLQFCDFDNLLENGTKNELERLKKAEFISEEDAALVRCREIDAFIKSDLFRDIRNAKNLYRELRFNVKLPAENFTSDVKKKELLKGREILVQGVIDCLIENADGTIHLVDYKTDRLTKAELENQKAGEERLRAAHSLQLSYYSEAVKIIFGKRPNKIGVYSLHLGREIEI